MHGLGWAGAADRHGPPEAGAGQQQGGRLVQAALVGVQESLRFNPAMRCAAAAATVAGLLGSAVGSQPLRQSQHATPTRPLAHGPGCPSPPCRSIMSEGDVGKRTQYIIEGLFSLRKAKWSG